jgi:glycosyltransferase involved in cell wall biosynthesis
VVDLATATVSIVIPTKNAGSGFRATLESIRSQTLNSELVVVDSGSCDGTLDLGRQFGAQTISIPAGSFNHGETRNLGVRRATGQFCVMLVQDAVPVGETWLEHLISPFCDERVVGVSARQMPAPNADPVARWDVEYRNRFLGDVVRVEELESWDHFLSLTFEERLRVASCDNVCSAMRRDFWERCPFRILPFGEDLDWGVRALAAGYRLVYNPSVRVIHSHSRPATYHLRRSYISGKVVPKILHLPPVHTAARNDSEFLALLGFLAGEMQHLAAGGSSDWRAFCRSCGVKASLWDSFLMSIRLRPPRPSPKLNAIRTNLHFLLEQVADFQSSDGVPNRNTILAQVFAKVVGDFAASYYNWCEVRGVLSEGMRRLDDSLSKGV